MTDSNVHDSLCPPNILARFLQVLYGAQAPAEALRRAEGRTGANGRDVRRLWMAVKGLLEARRNA